MASVAYPSATTSTCYCTASSSSTQIQSCRPCLLSPTSSSINNTCSPAITASRRRRRRTIATAISANRSRAALPLCSAAIALPRFRSAHSPFLSLPTSSSSPSSIRRISSSLAAASKAGSDTDSKRNDSEKKQVEGEEEVEELEEDLPWIQDRVMDLVEFTGSVVQAIPGPRVGKSSMPWMLAIPLAYVGITFAMAFVKTVRKFSSPKEIRRKMVNKNAALCKSVDNLLEKGRDGIQQSSLKRLMQKTGFSIEEILRKYIRYSLNEKPFNPDLVANLIQLRKASLLEDSQVAEILNEISRRIVKDKGPVVMDAMGYSEQGFKRKLAVQALFGKVYYLSELPEFCSRDSSLIVKEIFGVTDEDAEKLRLHTLSEYGDLDSLEKMVEDSDSEDTSDGSSNIAP